jgi:hypothetical protein
MMQHTMAIHYQHYRYLHLHRFVTEKEQCHNDPFQLLNTVVGALSAGNTKSQFKTISKRTKGSEIFSDSNALLNPCGYPEEKISHSKEKQEEEKEGISAAEYSGDRLYSSVKLTSAL